jgi:putative tricarboxylic transport membrane protein
LRLPQTWLLPIVVLLCLVGTYAVGNSLVDLWVLTIAGVAGWALRKFGFEPALIVLALVLGPILEKTFRQTLIMTRGDLGMMADRPITIGLLLFALAVVLAPALAAGLRRLRSARA